jgi:hypothetical protein
MFFKSYSFEVYNHQTLNHLLYVLKELVACNNNRVIQAYFCGSIISGFYIVSQQGA